ncbi:hypothetical protein PHISP_08725, partial [Aspergillus sp. HF37]
QSDPLAGGSGSDAVRRQLEEPRCQPVRHRHGGVRPGLSGRDGPGAGPDGTGAAERGRLLHRGHHAVADAGAAEAEGRSP